MDSPIGQEKAALAPIDISPHLAIIVVPPWTEISLDSQWIQTMVNRFLPKMDFRKIAELSSIGLMLPSSIAIGLFFGYILDRALGTHPWMLFVFLLLGIISGFYSLFRALRKFK